MKETLDTEKEQQRLKQIAMKQQVSDSQSALAAAQQQLNNQNQHLQSLTTQLALLQEQLKHQKQYHQSEQALDQEQAQLARQAQHTSQQQTTTLTTLRCELAKQQQEHLLQCSQIKQLSVKIDQDNEELQQLQEKETRIA